MSSSNATIQVLRFSSERSADIRGLFGDDAVVGDVRHVLRRRARSHKRYVARRFRPAGGANGGRRGIVHDDDDNGIFASGLYGDDAGGDSAQSDEAPHLSRRSRRRSGKRLRSELAAREQRDSGVAVRCATSVWHAKRMVMAALWGVRIALHHNERGLKSVLRHVYARPRGPGDSRRLNSKRRLQKRMSKRSSTAWDPVQGPAVAPRAAKRELPVAAVHDASHANSCIELRAANRAALIELLLHFVLPCARDEARRSLAVRTVAPDFLLRHPDAEGGQVIAPVRLMWSTAASEDEAGEEEEAAAAALLVWCHVAAVDELAAAFEAHDCGASGSVALRRAPSMKLSTFDIVGRGADELVLAALQHAHASVAAQPLTLPPLPKLEPTVAVAAVWALLLDRSDVASASSRLATKGGKARASSTAEPSHFSCIASGSRVDLSLAATATVGERLRAVERYCDALEAQCNELRRVPNHDGEPMPFAPRASTEMASEPQSVAALPRGARLRWASLDAATASQLLDDAEEQGSDEVMRRTTTLLLCVATRRVRSYLDGREELMQWTLTHCNGARGEATSRQHWMSLVRCGGWAAGVQEHHALMTELGEPTFPLDFPGSAAGDAMWSLLALAGAARDARRPPSKRLNRNPAARDLLEDEDEDEASSDGGGEDGDAPPFVEPETSQSRPPWELLFASAIRDRDHSSLCAFRTIHDEGIAAIDAATPTLVRVRLTMRLRGVPKPCATLYAGVGEPEEEDGAVGLSLQPIGFVTSGQYSERRGCGVAVAYITRAAAVRGGLGRSAALGTIAAPPCGVLLRNPGKQCVLREAWLHGA